MHAERYQAWVPLEFRWSPYSVRALIAAITLHVISYLLAE